MNPTFSPPLAATSAGPIHLLYLALNANAILFTGLIFLGLIFFSVRYRRGNKVDRSNAPVTNIPLEIAWTVIPLALAMGLFVWSTALFLQLRRVPKGAMEIFVVGKQWMWKLQHPEGRWEMNELHVPMGRPVVLTMTSEDVIHSFFVPAFRIKTDVFPGQYTKLWFQPTRPGTYHLFCAEFCGTFHSRMKGTVTVLEPADYQEWLSTGQTAQTMAAEGKALFMQYGCFGCHGEHGSVRAPRLDGIYGKPVAIQVPPPGVTFAGLTVDRGEAILRNIPATTAVADALYIHDSIVLPEKQIAAGYYPVMPSFKGQLSEPEILQIMAYIRSLSMNDSARDQRANREPETRTLTPEEYRTRTGFVPANLARHAAKRSR